MTPLPNDQSPRDEDLLMVHAVQHDIVFEDAQATLDHLDKRLDAWQPAPSHLKHILVLPEMFATGYTMNAEIALAKAEDIVDWAKNKAERLGCYLIFGVVQQGDAGPENRALCATPSGQLMPSYAKTHPFSHTGEDRVYHPGDELVVWEIEGRKICPMICYDLRFPEVFRMVAKAGIDAFVVIASFPEKRREHWMALLRARAIENQCYVLGVNRCGEDPVASYSGDTVLYDFQGQPQQQLASDEAILSDELNFHWQLCYREHYRFLQDIRWV